jgi:hypothetical protein
VFNAHQKGVVVAALTFVQESKRYGAFDFVSSFVNFSQNNLAALRKSLVTISR